MSKYHGSKSALYVAQYNLSGYSNDIAPSMTLEVIDVTTQGQSGNPVKEVLPGLVAWKLSEKGFWDYALGTPDDVLNALLGTLAQVIYAPSGGGAGGVAYAGYSSPFSGADISSPVNGAVAFSLEITGSNRFARCKGLGNKTATGAENGAAQDLGAAGTQGVEAFVCVTAFSGTSATLKVQSSADGATGWADRATFTSITDATSERVAAGSTTDRYLRYALSGTFSSISFMVIARNVGVDSWNGS